MILASWLAKWRQSLGQSVLQASRFAEESQIRRFADLQISWGLQICESANLRFLEETQIRTFAATNLRFCVFSRNRKFADLQIGWGLQICESANLARGNADFRGYKSANLQIGDLRRGVWRGGYYTHTHPHTHTHTHIYIYICIYIYIWISSLSLLYS